MLKLFIDQDFNHDILRGLKARVPNIDAVTALDLGRSREKDEQHLLWAKSERRIILSHDVNTFTRTVWECIGKGVITPGLIVAPQLLPIGLAIEDLEIIVSCTEYADLESRIEFLPLK